MKALAGGILLLLLLVGTANAQVNFPLITDMNTTWLQSSDCLIGDCIYRKTQSFRIDGTDTVAGVGYYKMYMQENERTLGWSPTGTCLVDYNESNVKPYAFGLWDDNGKVYRYNPFDNTEMLVYDFTAEVGDTIPDPAYGMQSGWDHVVTNIDSVLIDGSYRTRWSVDQGWGDIIEGIGSNLGLTHTIGAVLECSNTLNCYAETGSAIYPSPGDSCRIDLLHLDVASHENPLNLVTVYLDDRVKITTGQSQQPIGYSLYNMKGQLLEQGAMPNGGELPYYEYPSGFYLLELKVGEQQARQKIFLK